MFLTFEIELLYESAALSIFVSNILIVESQLDLCLFIGHSRPHNW